jgi:hypothetical protein
LTGCTVIVVVVVDDDDDDDVDEVNIPEGREDEGSTRCETKTTQ